MGESIHFLLPPCAQPLLLLSFPPDIPPEFLRKCIALAQAEGKRCVVSPPSTEGTSTSPPSIPSETEAAHFYAGLPSRPRLLARTSSIPWERPTGPEAYCIPKQLEVLANHKLNAIWENDVAPKVIACLDELKVEWTSLDIVRIGEVDAFPYPTLWIGVKPNTLAGKDALTTAFSCLDILKSFDITDVNVDLRESSVIRLAGPKLLPPDPSSNSAADARHPLTHALGLQISAEATPSVVGTGGFFMAEGGDSDKLLLITSRHVVLPLNVNGASNDKYEYKNTSKARLNVLILGDKAYNSYLTSIRRDIGVQGMMIDYGQRRIEGAEELEDKWVDKERKAGQAVIDEAEKATEELHALYNDVEKNWATPESRVLGHVVCSPPIRLGAGTVDEQYTEDFAIIEVDKDKIDRTTFTGNTIDLGTKILTREFTEKMYPHLWRDPSYQSSPNRLLKLSGTISDDEIRHPTDLDANDEPYMVVMKNGSNTGTTIGHASSIKSFVREYFDDGSHQTSMEWAILPYDYKTYAFSGPGDSGAVVVDVQGRVGGLLTGGSGRIAASTDSDITYATPIDFLLKSIKANGYPNAHLNLA